MPRSRLLIRAVLLLAAVGLLAAAPVSAQTGYSASITKTSQYTAPLPRGRALHAGTDQRRRTGAGVAGDLPGQ